MDKDSGPINNHDFIMLGDQAFFTSMISITSLICTYQLGALAVGLVKSCLLDITSHVSPVYVLFFKGCWSSVVLTYRIKSLSRL